MTHEEECQYFKMALALVGICTDEKTVDLAVRTMRGIHKKKGKVAIDDAVGIKFRHEEAWIERTVKAEKEKENDKSKD